MVCWIITFKMVFYYDCCCCYLSIFNVIQLAVEQAVESTVIWQCKQVSFVAVLLSLKFEEGYEWWFRLALSSVIHVVLFVLLHICISWIMNDRTNKYELFINVAHFSNCFTAASYCSSQTLWKNLGTLTKKNGRRLTKIYRWHNFPVSWSTR